MSNPDIFPIREAVRRLSSAITRFNQAWPETAKLVLASEIPNRANNHRPDYIEVNTLTGEAAIDAAKDAFSRFHRDQDQHPGTVFRLPGIILTETDWRHEIDTINMLKGRVRALMSEVPSDRRARFARQALPGINVLQIYREIDFFSMPYNSVSFTWAGHTQSSERVTSQDLWNRIESMPKPDTMTDDEFAALRQRQQQTLSQHSNMVIRRVKSPHPRVQFKEFGNPSVTGRILPASIPVFALLHAGQDMPAVHLLDSYSEANAKKRQQRSDARQHEAVIPSLNVYTTGAA